MQVCEDKSQFLCYTFDERHDLKNELCLARQATNKNSHTVQNDFFPTLYHILHFDKSIQEMQKKTTILENPKTTDSGCLLLYAFRSSRSFACSLTICMRFSKFCCVFPIIMLWNSSWFTLILHTFFCFTLLFGILRGVSYFCMRFLFFCFFGSYFRFCLIFRILPCTFSWFCMQFSWKFVHQTLRSL